MRTRFQSSSYLPLALRLGPVLIWMVFLVAGSVAQSGRRPVRPPATPPVTTPAAPTDPEVDNRPLVDTAPISQDEEGTIRVDTSLVTIPVTVTDRQGRFIPDLSKRNFRLYEDDIEQRIDSLVAVDVPFNVVLMLDTSGSTRAHLEDIQEAAIAFVGQLRSEDRVMVVSFAMRHRVECEFTSDRAELFEAIRQTRTGGGTRLYEAVDFVLNRLEAVEGRKAVVLFTDGADTLSRRATARSTLERAEESGAIFYPLSYDTRDSIGGPGGPPRSGVPPVRIPNVGGWPFPGGGRRRWPLANPFDLLASSQWPGRLPSGLPASSDQSGGYLAELAERSGGRLSEAGNIYSVSAAFSLIAAELRQQYALSYYPGNTSRDGSWRRIRVRIDQPECIVRARKGYRISASTP